MSRRSVTILTMAVLIAWAVHGRADDKPAHARWHRPARSPAWWSTCKAVRSPGPRSGAFADQEKFGPTRSGADGRFRLAATQARQAGHRLGRRARPGARASRRRPHLPRQGPRHRPAHAPARHPDARPRRRCAGQTSRRGGRQARPLPLPARPHDLLAGDRVDVRAPTATAASPRPRSPPATATSPSSAPGKVRTFVQKKAEPGTPVVDLGDVTLPDEMPVAGIVTDGEGKPAPGVEVIPDYDWQNSVKTDKDGRFTRPRRRQGPQESPPPVERLLHPQAVRRRPRPD